MTSDTFLPLVGGGEIHVKEISENMVRMGHQVTLVTNQEGKGEDTFPFKIIRIPWKKSNLFKLLAILYREAGEADIIHSHYSYRLSAIACLVAFIRRKPVIEVLHGLGTLDEAGSKFPYTQVHAIYRFLSLNLATRIVSTSEDIAVVARQHMIVKDKIDIIFNGLNTRRFNKQAEIPQNLKEKYRGKKLILTVRRLVPKNGVHFLVESMPYVLKKVPNAHYLMIGTGRMQDYIKGRIADLGLGDHVEMLGEIENSQVPSYMNLADTIVFPSTAESSSIACAEAFAMGKVVVASRVGGLIELIGKNNERGILVKLVDWEGSDYDAPLELGAERYEDLARIVAESLLNDQTERKDRAEQYAREELDWSVIAGKTLRVYDKVLK